MNDNYNMYMPFPILPAFIHIYLKYSNIYYILYVQLVTVNSVLNLSINETFNLSLIQHSVE